ETHRRLQALADATTHTYPDRIEPHLIVPHELPEDLVGKGEILLDPRGELHHRYGARSACLYVVRPDGYIGFRSQPPNPEALKSYFTQIFIYRGGETPAFWIYLIGDCTHKSMTLIDVRLAPTSGAKADLS